MKTVSVSYHFWFQIFGKTWSHDESDWQQPLSAVTVHCSADESGYFEEFDELESEEFCIKINIRWVACLLVAQSQKILNNFFKILSHSSLLCGDQLSLQFSRRYFAKKIFTKNYAPCFLSGLSRDRTKISSKSWSGSWRRKKKIFLAVESFLLFSTSRESESARNFDCKISSQTSRVTPLKVESVRSRSNRILQIVSRFACGGGKC